MGKSLEEFKNFVRTQPHLKDVVAKNERTWQQIYEEWFLYGPDSLVKQEEKNNVNLPDSMKDIYSMIKKINPDSLAKTLNTAQKFITVFQGFQGAGKNVPNVNAYPRDPLFGKFSDFE